MLEPIIKDSLYSHVINQLLEQIKKGTWTPGDSLLGEKDLAKQFQVSRNSVREALKTLQYMEILESYPSKGTFVTKNAMRIIQNSELIQLLSNNNGKTLDLLEIRMAIEVQSADIAAKRASKKEIDTLKCILNKLEKKIISGEDHSLEGVNFHFYIAKISKNQYIINFFQTISEEMLAQRNPRFQRKINVKRSLMDHKNIYNAIAENNQIKARNAMYEHFIHAIEDIESKSS